MPKTVYNLSILMLFLAFQSCLKSTGHVEQIKAEQQEKRDGRNERLSQNNEENDPTPAKESNTPSAPTLSSKGTASRYANTSMDNSLSEEEQQARLMSRKRNQFIAYLNKVSMPDSLEWSTSKKKYFYYVMAMGNYNYSCSNIFSIEPKENNRLPLAAEINQKYQKDTRMENFWLNGPFPSEAIADKYKKKTLNMGSSSFCSFIAVHRFEYEKAKPIEAIISPPVRITEDTVVKEEEVPAKVEVAIKPKGEAPVVPKDFGKFTITKATSLRTLASSSSKVIKRLYPNYPVTVLEKTEKYWWKVNYKGKIGYVKAFLLEQ